MEEVRLLLLALVSSALVDAALPATAAVAEPGPPPAARGYPEQVGGGLGLGSIADLRRLYGAFQRHVPRGRAIG